jgi:hypothetical protein
MIDEDERAAAADRRGFVLHLGDFIYEIVWYRRSPAGHATGASATSSATRTRRTSGRLPCADDG